MQQKYLSTGKMAQFIGKSSDYLRNRQGIDFIDGKHFFKKGRTTFWVIDEIVNWVESKEEDDPFMKDVLSSLCA